VAALPCFNKLISLAICTVLENLDPSLHPKIKWPNDIYIDGKKAGGILIENALAGHRIQHLIAGIGINVNETSFPGELSNAISLRMICGKPFDILELANSIRDSILMEIQKEPRRCEVRRGTDFPLLKASAIQKGKSEGYEPTHGNFEGQKNEGHSSEGWEREYADRLFMKNEITSFNHEGTIIRGKVRNVDESGRLVLEMDGIEKSFYTHEIKWII
jgi:biotin-(acetyl-CoA carboxylase) ligase